MIETVHPSRLRRIRSVVAALTTMLFGVAVVPPTTARAGEEVFASVGTGELNGVYYPVGKAICEIVNRDLSIDGVRCSPETTPGSVYNIHAIQSGELEFSIVQADVNFNAYKGEGAWGANRLSICDPCYRCIPNSSPSWLARIRIFRILQVWQAAGSMWAARVPASGRPGTPSKRSSAGVTMSGCGQWR